MPPAAASPIQKQENQKSDTILSAIPTPLSKTSVPTLEELQRNTYHGRPFLFGHFPEPPAENAKTSQDYSNPAAKTVDALKARAALFEKEAAKGDGSFFSSRLQERLLREQQARLEWENYQKNRVNFLPLLYGGDKTMIRIPPNNVVEVPLADHIPYFFTRIEVMADGSLTVHETIQRVVSKKNASFYGLDRYFPYEYRDRAGKTHKTRLFPMAATHNGQPVVLRMYPSVFGVRVSMEEDKPLAPGVHVYRWSYRIADKITDYGDFKELVWSVTGNQWFFPVTRAGAHVIFPQKTEVIAQSARTGDFPLTDDLYRTKRDANGDISFSLQYPVGAGEDFVIMANFKELLPAFVPPKTLADVLAGDHAAATASVVMFLFVLSYYWVTWHSIRKNQISSFQNMKPAQKNEIFPAVVRYALLKKTDAKNVFILILSMATKGFLAFKEVQDGLLLIKKKDSTAGLSAMEKKIASALFSKKETSFMINEANGLKLSRLFDVLARMIRKDYGDKYVTVYLTYFLFGLLMTAVSVGAIAAVSDYPAGVAATAAGIMLLTVAEYLIVLKWLEEKRADRPLFQRAALTVAGVFFALPCFMLIWFFGVQTGFVAAFFLTATLVCVPVSYSLLKSPSVLGRSVLDTLDAYRVYLSSPTAESSFAAMRDASGKLRLLYDKHIAFAVALDLGADWTRKVIANAADPAALKPVWYAGKMPFDDAFIDKLFEIFALHFPKKTVFFDKKRAVSSRPRPTAGSTRFGNK